MENNEWKRIEKELDELINCLLTSNAQMERALSWYADNGNYLGDNGELSTAYKNKMPNKAREALGHLSEPEYPKLTPEQIQERKEAIEWIRNPGGMRWVKAIDIEVKPRITYYAKLVGDNTIIRSTGWFQESNGTFFWNELGYVPIGIKERDKLLLLDEGKEVEND